jgi:biotin carboxylase
MTGAAVARPTDLPKLAVVFDPRGTRSVRLSEAAAGSWEILWLVDTARYDLGSTVRLLARLGTVVDTADLEPDEIATLLEPLHPAGIITFADAEMVRTAQIARAAGLSFHTPEVALLLTNKIAQREAFEAAGLPVPRFWAVPAGADAATRRHVAGVARFPVIVKPQAGAGGRQTYRAVDAADFLRQLDAFAETSDADLAAVIVEELLADSWARDSREYADYVSVESVAENGRLTHLAVTGRLPLSEPFRESGFFIPSNLPADVLADVCDLAGRAIDAVGAATRGIFHTEIKLTPDGPRVIEINGRIGGRTPDIFALSSDILLLEIAARVALGLPADVVAPVRFTGVGYLTYVQPPMNATSLVRLDGVKELGTTEGIHDVVVNKRPGDVIDWRDGNQGFVIAVVGWAPDHDAVFAARHRVAETIDVEYGFAATATESDTAAPAPTGERP